MFPIILLFNQKSVFTTETQVAHDPSTFHLRDVLLQRANVPKSQNVKKVYNL